MKTRLTFDDHLRVHTLLAEGMPSSWIAEDIGRSRDTVLPVARRRGDHAEAVREWKSVWSQIKNNAVLLALHEQF